MSGVLTAVTGSHRDLVQEAQAARVGCLAGPAGYRRLSACGTHRQAALKGVGAGARADGSGEELGGPRDWG
jgi:hypothetical protein